VQTIFRILLAIISGISTYFAFPFIYFFLVDRVLGHGVLGIEILTVTFSACFAVLFLVYYSLRRRDVEKIRMRKSIQAVIVFTSIILTLVAFSGTSPASGVSGYLWSIALYLNFFFLSTIILASLYYLLRT
jgi:predicted permease